MKKLLVIVRWLIGLLFIFSGLVKANDPHGLSYKMQEFFEVWGWHTLHNYTLPLALMLNVFEIVAGVAVIVGCQKKLVNWLLLLLIIAFTFLTGYALFSGKIKTCGCFGDCIPLTSGQSFMKDLALLVLIIFLIIASGKNNKSVFNLRSMLIVVSSLIASIALQFYVLKYLPIVDCLPYKQGNNIQQQMQTPAGAIPDSFAMHFIYQKNGKEISFDQSNFPADFDSSYIYVNRKDELVKKGNGLKAGISDFSLRTESDNDTTALLFETPKYVMILAKDFDSYTQWESAVKSIIDQTAKQKIPIVLVTADAKTGSEKIQNIPVLKCDGTVLKTAARVTPTIFLMEGASIRRKYSYRDLASIETAIRNW
ncbi:MAG: DoxX family protein [Bacteroidetes bacterium]|nr:DoxX family protein [Bacteroidota bacterium]